jgi:hypothetical protein
MASLGEQMRGKRGIAEEEEAWGGRGGRSLGWQRRGKIGESGEGKPWVTLERKTWGS